MAAKDKMAYGVQQNTKTEARVNTLRKKLGPFLDILKLAKAYHYCYFELLLHCLCSDISNTNGA